MVLKRTFSAVLCAILAFALCFAALPKGARADESYTMDFTSVNAETWAGGVVPATTNASGTGWSWNASGKTLTLDGLHFTTSAATAMILPSGTTIVLNSGKANSVTSTYSGSATDNERSYGILCNSGAITVSGSGSLTATGGSGSANLEGSCGIEASGITLSGSASLTGIGGSTNDESYGVFLSDGASVIKDSASLTCRGGSAGTDSYGICCAPYSSATITVQDNGRLHSVAGDAGENSVGVLYVDEGALNLKGGTLIAKAGTGSGVYSVGALYAAPSLADYASYRWRTNASGSYTNSSVAPFVYQQNAFRYVEIGPIPAPAAAKAAVPKTGDDAPTALLLGLALFAVAGLALRRKARREQ